VSIALKKFAILVSALALVLVSVPANACDGTAEEPAGRHDHACDPAHPANDETDRGGHEAEDDCCPTECPNCYHACCIGIVCLPALAENFVAELSTRSTLSFDQGEPTAAHARPVDHPPNR